MKWTCFTAILEIFNIFIDPQDKLKRNLQWKKTRLDILALSHFPLGCESVTSVWMWRWTPIDCHLSTTKSQSLCALKQI